MPKIITTKPHIKIIDYQKYIKNIKNDISLKKIDLYDNIFIVRDRDGIIIDYSQNISDLEKCVSEISVQNLLRELYYHASLNGYISIVDWSFVNDLKPNSARAKAARGAFKTAIFENNRWLIDARENNEDGRLKTGKYIGWHKKYGLKNK